MSSLLPTKPAAPALKLPDQARIQSYGNRTDGTPKGVGFFGEIPRVDDPKSFSSELSATADLTGPDGKPVLFPLLVPTLTREEINYLVSTSKLNSNDPKARAIENTIYQKAQDFAAQRLKQGLSPFANPGEQVPLPESEEQAMQHGYAGTRSR